MVEELTKKYIQNFNRYKDVEDILNLLFKEKNGFFYEDTQKNDRTRREKTRFIKRELVKLGHKKRYKVYANNLNDDDIDNIDNDHSNGNNNKKSNFVNTEWLFDLEWYEEPENTKYIVKKYHLLMECEWDYRRKKEADSGKNKKEIDRYGAMKYDFLKLLIAKADLRLMIFKLRADYDKNNDLSKLDDYFKNALDSFEGLDDGFNLIIIGVLDTKRRRGFYIFDYLNYRRSVH